MRGTYQYWQCVLNCLGACSLLMALWTFMTGRDLETRWTYSPLTDPPTPFIKEHHPLSLTYPPTPIIKEHHLPSTYPPTSIIKERRLPLPIIKEHDLSTTAHRISKANGFVFLLFLNAGYVEMTKSFVCNLRSIKGGADMLSHVIFVTTDDVTSQTLADFAPEVGGIFTNEFKHRNSDLNYGTYEYFRLTVERVKMQQKLLNLGVHVVVIEADATWFEDADRVERLLRAELTRHEVVSAHDNAGGMISAGFLGIASSNRTRKFFESYTNKYTAKLDNVPSKGRKSIGNVGEQHTMTEMLATTDKDLVVKWLDTGQFARGQWYAQPQYRARCGMPWVLQNNYIVGNSAKIKRAKQWKHWFLEKETCIS